MKNYYVNNLSADRLKLCYEIAPPRVMRYLQAEINFVNSHIKAEDVVLELGCGYGRAIHLLPANTKLIYGIDISYESLSLAQNEFSERSNICLSQMNSVNLGFRNKRFDVVICIQNGISAFKVNRVELIKEALRVTKTNGVVLFSSYSDKFWNDRLDWFKIQSGYKLVGEIDYSKTKNGIIACRDGFVSNTITEEEFRSLCLQLGYHLQITEIDKSSVFCVIKKSEK